MNCTKCNKSIFKCGCFIHMCGPLSSPPPNTKENIINQLKEFSNKLYKDYSGNPEIAEIENGVTIRDKESYVNILLEGNESINVEAACYTIPILELETSKTCDYKIIGKFKGYQQACREAFTHFIYQKCGDVWVDGF